MLCSIPGCINEAKIKHHISYFPEETTAVCETCHKEIHHGKYPNLLRYKKGDAQIFYKQKARIEQFLERLRIR